MNRWRILSTPWASQVSTEPIVSVCNRPILLVPPAVTQVRVRDQGIDLPRSGTRRVEGEAWNAFEILATGRDQGGQESLELETDDGLLNLQLERGLQSPSASEGDSDEEHDGHRVFGLIGRHVDLVYGAVDEQAQLIEGCASPDFGDFVSGWRKSEDTEEARHALIVRIAEQVGQVMRSIGDNPRVVLRRKRTMQRVGAVRQIDPAGVRWLVRQRGSTLAERAGPRQRVLAVVREETVDTHENRVMRDMIERCINECRGWLRDNKPFSTTDRYSRVRRFSSSVRGMRRLGPLASVSRASGTVEPNYVLQHDERYSRVWPWYVKLRRRQQEEDRLWRWSHRTFGESVRLALAWALEQIEEEDELPFGAGFSRQLLLRPEQQYGCFVDPRTELAGWLARRVSGELVAMSVLVGDQIKKFESVAGHRTCFGNLAPDALIVAHDPFHLGKPYRAVAVWARLRFDGSQRGQDYFDGLADSLSEASGGLPVQAMIVEPCPIAGGRASKVDERNLPHATGAPFQVHVLESPLRLNRARSEFQEILRGALLA